MIAAYDLDGVLCEPFHLKGKPWQKMNGEERRAKLKALLGIYETVRPLFQPEERSFHIITSRKDNVEVRGVTVAWLQKHFPGRVESLNMLRVSRNIENVVAFKAQVLRDLKATDFTEDNWKVVRELRKQGLDCRIWHYTNGNQVLDC